MESSLLPEVPTSEHFSYRGDQLHCEGVPLREVATEFGTPSFVYSASAIDRAFDALDRAVREPHLVAYAVKANSSLSVLARLAAKQCGADIVSGGELARCLRAGIAPDRIVFSGVGKTDEELAFALETGIRAVHVESAPELLALEAIARRRGQAAKIALRVNPNVNAETHPYIATGLHNTKFGLEIDSARALLPRIVASESLCLEGVACHIGSQLPSTAPMEEAVTILGRFAQDCIAAGAPIRSIDVGGGWPLRYGDEDHTHPSWDAFGQAISRGLAAAGIRDLGLIVEPGRALVGDAGALLTRVIYVKEQADKRFVIVDAAMSDLIRPSLYDAYHAVMAVEPREGAAAAADLVGPICETGDFFARDRHLPPLARGDLVLLRGAGAYGTAMASNYNSRPLAAEVMCLGDQARTARRRQRIEDITRLEERAVFDPT